MLDNKYHLGTTIAVFLIMGVTLTSFQATNSSDFVAYGQTDSKAMSDSKQTNAEQLLTDPKFRQQIINTMKKNHDIAQEIITKMIDDPALRLQLLGHLTENKEAMQDLMKLFGQNGGDMNIKMGSMMDHSGMPMKKDSSKTEMKDSMKKETKKDATKKDSMKMDSMMDHGSMSMKKDSMKTGTSASVDFSNVKISSISANSATVQGTTNQAVNCQVEYWTAKDTKHYLASDTGDMMDMKHTDHKVTIKNLTPNTKYSYKFKATLDGKTFYSSEKTFTTKSS
ncbi:MAG: fibronectin type III domain-containing protein [Candidatus Nitrosotenuis sp.]